MPLDVSPGDVLTLRKPHPCGGYEWTVLKAGTEIGLVCNTCRRQVILPRDVLEKRARKITRKGGQRSSGPGKGGPVA